MSEESTKQLAIAFMVVVLLVLGMAMSLSTIKDVSKCQCNKEAKP